MTSYPPLFLKVVRPINDFDTGWNKIAITNNNGHLKELNTDLCQLLWGNKLCMQPDAFIVGIKGFSILFQYLIISPHLCGTLWHLKRHLCYIFLECGKFVLDGEGKCAGTVELCQWAVGYMLAVGHLLKCTLIMETFFFPLSFLLTEGPGSNSHYQYLWAIHCTFSLRSILIWLDSH